MDTGVRDLEVACFQANFTWINDIGSKDLSNSPTYAVLNTHNLDMILQLKYLTIRLQARVFYEQIVNEAQPSWLSLVENEGE